MFPIPSLNLLLDLFSISLCVLGLLLLTKVMRNFNNSPTLAQEIPHFQVFLLICIASLIPKIIALNSASTLDLETIDYFFHHHVTRFLPKKE